MAERGLFPNEIDDPEKKEILSATSGGVKLNEYRLSRARTSMKLLVTMFLICMALAYLMALFNTYDKTHFTYSGIVANYRGNEEELIYPKELPEMIEISHPHLLGMPMMFLLLCVILMFTSANESLKKGIVFLSFAAIILDVGSFWLTRYVAPQFAILMFLAGLLMGVCFLLLFIIPFWEMWLS